MATSDHGWTRDNEPGLWFCTTHQAWQGDCSQTNRGNRMKLRLGLLAAAAYVAVVVLANILSSRYGMVQVGLGLMASAGTYAAGAALGLRDVVREGLGRWAMLGVIAVGSALSFWLADAFIATASLAAFSASELLDATVYEVLRSRSRLLAALVSNTFGAALDTWVFLSLAPFGPITAQAFWGQMVGKIVWATLVPLALLAVVRDTRRTA